MTLVLVNVYEGILISYVTSKPRVKPLVESPDDLLSNSKIHLVVEKGQGADFIFSVGPIFTSNSVKTNIISLGNNSYPVTHLFLDRRKWNFQGFWRQIESLSEVKM